MEMESVSEIVAVEEKLGDILAVSPSAESEKEGLKSFVRVALLLDGSDALVEGDTETLRVEESDVVEEPVGVSVRVSP